MIYHQKHPKHLKRHESAVGLSKTYTGFLSLPLETYLIALLLYCNTVHHPASFICIALSSIAIVLRA